MVLLIGFEPIRLSALDFESSVSANSTTEAYRIWWRTLDFNPYLRSAKRYAIHDWLTHSYATLNFQRYPLLRQAPFSDIDRVWSDVCDKQNGITDILLTVLIAAVSLRPSHKTRIRLFSLTPVPHYKLCIKSSAYRLTLLLFWRFHSQTTLCQTRPHQRYLPEIS